MMKNILIIGAGRSSGVLIEYLLENSGQYEWKVKVADRLLDWAKEKVKGHGNGAAVQLDIFDEVQRKALVKEADVVISMLPANMHAVVAQDCLEMKKDMVTASYLSDKMNKLGNAAKEAGIVMMNEIGLDPGIDHMATMEIIDRVKAAGGKLLSYKSYTGGLIAPESDNNPWNYKFTWAPRNVILAGQGTAKFIEDGKLRFIPYHELFKQIETIEVEGWGKFDGYANRDSIAYKDFYGIQEIPTILRGTLRKEGFCRAWQAFVQLGWTDDTYPISGSQNLTYTALLESYLPKAKKSGLSLKERLANYVGESLDSEVMYKLEWLGLFDNRPVTLPDATPAQILQDLLEEKWQLEQGDKDMIVMQHQFEYEQDGEVKNLSSSLVVIGEDVHKTAMAKTVGLPAAIFTKLLLTGEIQVTGVKIPTEKSVYEPVLKELEANGVQFIEREEVLTQ